MAVTELALLSLLPPSTLNDTSLWKKLNSAKNAMETFTQRNLFFFSQIENPASLYIIGEWEDVKQHREDYIPSQTNQQMLALLKDQVSVEWLIHIDIDQENLPFSAPIISVSRHFISSGQKETYGGTFEAVSHHLRSYVTPSHFARGWRTEREEGSDQEEDLLIAGWDNVASHHAFAQSDGFEELARIREFMKDADIKYAKRIDV